MRSSGEGGDTRSGDVAFDTWILFDLRASSSVCCHTYTRYALRSWRGGGGDGGNCDCGEWGGMVTVVVAIVRVVSGEVW